MNNLKKILSIAITGVLAFQLTACGSSQSSNNSNQSNNNTSTNVSDTNKTNTTSNNTNNQKVPADKKEIKKDFTEEFKDINEEYKEQKANYQNLEWDEDVNEIRESLAEISCAVSTDKEKQILQSLEQLLDECTKNLKGENNTDKIETLKTQITSDINAL